MPRRHVTIGELGHHKHHYLVNISAKYALAELGQRIERERKSLSPLSFSGFGIENVQSILESGVEFRPEIPEADKRRIVWDAIGKAAGNVNVTADVLTKALCGEETKYLRQPMRRFVLLTSITIDRSHVRHVVQIDKSRIYFSRLLPNGYSRAPIKDKVADFTKIDPGTLAYVRVPVRARTEASGFEIGMERLDFWRGLLNYQVNAKTALRMTRGERAAVNQILLGPVHTLHSPRGKLVTEAFWYEPFPQQSAKRADLRGPIDKLYKNANLLRQRIKACRYGSDLRSLLVRYTRALDRVDYTLAYSALWSVLEHLAGCVGEYKRLVERIVFLYDPANAAFARLLIEHPRDVRNGLVHESQERTEMETYLYQLKTFVEALFRFHLSRDKHYSSISTATAFLDLPLDTSVLQERIILLRRAHRFRSPRSAV